MQPSIIKSNPNAEYFFEEGCYILEYSNSDKDADLSIARARVSPNTSTQLHKLSNTIERYFIIEGKGEITLGPYQQQKEKHSLVEAGDTVIIPADCPQAIRNTGDSDLIFLVMCTPRFKPEHYSEC